jgi:hypothetical protein
VDCVGLPTGAEMVSVDGWEAHGEVAECGTSGGHADGAGEGDEEGGVGHFRVVAEAGATKSYRVVSQYQGEGWEFVGWLCR